jgi:hypothetical protein
MSYFAVRDWDAYAEILSDDVCMEDRRHVVNAGVRHGRDAEIASQRAVADVGVTHFTSTVIAIRGRRLALGCYSVFDGWSGSKVLCVSEINAENQIVARVAFDSDDLDAAFTELDARYLAGEAAAHEHTWSVITQFIDAFNRQDIPPTDWVTIDHRPLITTDTSDLPALIRDVWGLTPDLTIHIEAVHQLSSFGTVVTRELHGTSREGFEAEWRMLQLLTVEGDRITRSELFDETDLDAALARFDELQPQAPRLENAASQVGERFWKHFAAREWAAMAELIADDTSTDDRRRVVNAGNQHGRDADVATMRALADLGVAHITSTVIATRGERLALTRARMSGRDQRPDAFYTEALSILEIDADNRGAAKVVFDPDDIEAAIEELDARYLAGEAAAHPHSWSAITQACAALSRHEMPRTATSFVDIDHRQFAAIAPGDLITYLRAGLEDMVDVVFYVEAVHRLSALGAVVTHTAKGTSVEGFYAEWRMIDVFTVEGDLISRFELFDEADLDAALARFEELHTRTRRPENAASQVAERYWKHFAAREWAAMAELVALDISTDDRRRVVNAGIRHGRDDHMADMRAIAEVLPDGDITSAVMAARGARLVLTRICILSRGMEVSEVIAEVLRIDEIDADNRIVSGVAFDIDDVDAAIAELEARYLAGEAAGHADAWSLIAQAYTAVNRHELPPTTPDWVNIDHRRGRAFAPGDLGAYLDATWDLAPDVNVYVEAVHRLSNPGGVVTHCAHGSSREGFDAEWREVILLTFEAGRVNHFEVFDEGDLAAALARLDELNRQASACENAATQTWERLVEAYNHRDVEGFLALTTRNGRSEDRRKGLRHIAVGLEWQKTTRAWLDAPRSWWMDVEILAIRGSRLSLTRNRCRDTDEADQPVTVDVMAVMEVGEDGLVREAVTFDPDDIDDAFAELTARWIASGEVMYPEVVPAIDPDDGVAGTPQEAI